MQVNAVILLVCFLSLGEANLAFTKVEIANNGYTGLVIAIHPDVEESLDLINAIKDSWTEASRDLFIATGNRAFFRQITILVPTTWTNNSYSHSSGSENYDQADVVITPRNSTFGNVPYTVQHEGCGLPGIRTHFTPAYLLEDESIVNYGRRGKVIVHEWAHYRWGVFDETSETEPFYWDPDSEPANGPVATTCPKDLLGSILNAETNYTTRCSLADIDAVTNSYPKNCVFFPLEEQPLDTSVMAYQFLENVMIFCKEVEGGNPDPHNVHNRYAQNNQNRLCEMRSTWSVIKNSSDYQQWTVNNNSANTDPSFNVVTAQAQRFVLVLDDSGSMSSSCGDTTRTECLKTAAYQFLLCAPSNSYVGIVTFGTTATISDYLTLLDSEKDREDLAQSIVGLSADSGGTCIGCGIQDGIEVLKHGDSEAAGGRLIVITDGEENTEPFVKDVVSQVLTKGVIVDVIFVSNDGNLDLKSLSTVSGGVNYLANSSQSDLLQIVTGICNADTAASHSYQIHGATFTVTPSNDFESFVFIDSTIGADTIFTFTWSIEDNPPNIYITSPSGCVYSNYEVNETLCHGGDSLHDVNGDFSTIKFNIPGLALIGKWTYVVANQSTVGAMTSLVTSAKRNNDIQPIIVESGMSRTDIGTGAAIVYTKVTQGYNPILGALVVARVTGPDLAPKFLDLYDNGAGSDVNKDDGIYSRYFTEFTGPGRYGVDITVTGVPSTFRRLRRRRGDTKSSANYRPGVIAPDGTVVVNPNGAVSKTGNGPANAGIQSADLGEFSRIVPSESFDYNGTIDTSTGIPPADDFPPSKITDLRIQQNDLEDFTQGVIIQFTATGDDFDQGTAQGYDFRYTFGDPSSLLSNFNSCKTITESDILAGNMSDPSPAGELEEFIVKTPQLPTDSEGTVLNNSLLAFSIKACDSDFNYGDPSNVAIINFFIAPLIIPTAAAVSESSTITVTADNLLSTASVATTSSTKDTTSCIDCNDCEKEITFFKWLSSGLAVIAAIFVTSTIILAIWLTRFNRQLARKEKTLHGLDNVKMMEKGPSQKNWFQSAKPTRNNEEPQPWNDDFDF